MQRDPEYNIPVLFSSGSAHGKCGLHRSESLKTEGRNLKELQGAESSKVQAAYGGPARSVVSVLFDPVSHTSEGQFEFRISH